MNIIGSFVLFILFVLVYMIVVEIFVMLFRITGLTAEKARFQVVSLLTNSGYTTQESEIVVNSKNRRKLARLVMIFGYAFTVTIVSTVVNVFFQFRSTYVVSAVAFIPMLIAILLIAYFLKKNKVVNNMTDKMIKKIALKFAKVSRYNNIMVMDDYGSLVMAKIELKKMPKELENLELSSSNIKKEHGINIILKNTAKGEVIPDANTVFELGDTIVVIGEEKKVWQVFGIQEV